MARAIINHRIKLNELGLEFRGIHDLILVEGIIVKDLELLSPEIKVITAKERKLKPYKVNFKVMVMNHIIR